MKRLLLRVFALACVVATTGCQRACNKVMGRTIANAAEDDLRAILDKTGAKKPKVFCNTPYAVRESRCSAMLDKGEHDALVKQLGLASRPLEKWNKDQLLSCETFTFDRTVVRHARFDHLPAVDGVQLKQPYKSFDLYWDEKTSEACIELVIASR